MNGKKAIAFLTLALFLTASVAVVFTEASDQSDAAQTYTAEYYPDNTVYRCIKHTTDYSTQGVPIDDAAMVADADKKAQSYVNGEIQSLDIKTGYIGYNTDYYSYETWYGGNYSVDRVFTCDKSTTYIPINPGHYTICIRSVISNGTDISSDTHVNIRYQDSYGYYTSYSMSPNTNFEFDSYMVGSFYLGIDRQIHATITYELTPGPITDTYAATEKHSLGTNYDWYAGNFVMNAGSIVRIGNSGDVVIADPSKQALFEEEVVKQNKTYLYTKSSAERYGILCASYSDPLVLDSNTNVKIYRTSYYDVSKTEINYEMKYVDTTNYVSVKPNFVNISPETTESYEFFASANSTFKLSVDYDMSVYRVYLRYSVDSATYQTLLVPGTLYHIDNGQAKTYTISAEIDTKNNTISKCESLTADVCIYTGDLPASDSNVFIFAAICIAICVLAFGLLIHSGKKPKWGKVPKQK